MSIQSNFPNLKPSLLLDFANTRQLDNRVTFNRASTATFYDNDTAAVAEQNLVLQSQTFNVSPWALSNTTVTANATTAPDGTSTADKIIEDSANSAHAIYQALGTTSGPCTFSVYAKADTRSWLNLNTYIAGVRNTWFDLTNGVVGTVAAGCTATITSVGSGWYRCSVTTTGGSTTFFELWLATGNNVTTYAGNGTSGLFVWGAQLEQRSTVTTYTPTTTAAITNYVPVLLTAGNNQARFDCDPITRESLGLLIEEQRTNVFSISEGLTSWSVDGTGAVVVDSGTINPAGRAGGWMTKNAGYAYLTYGTGISAGTWTYSVYIKKTVFNTLNVGRVNMFSPSVSIDYNFGTGTVSLAAGAPVSYGCQRLSDTMARVWITVTIAGSTLGIGSFDTANNSTMIWGIQIESGAFPTSYIKTDGAGVTRIADIASMTGVNFTSWYAQSAGTLYAEYAHMQDTGASTVTGSVEMNDGTQNKFFQSGPYTYASNTANVFTKNASSLNANSTTALISRNGSTLGPYIDSGLSISGLTQLVFGVGRIYYPFPVRIKKAAYYPIAVTQSQLNALTS